MKERKVEGMPTDRFAELDPKIKRHVQAYFGLFLKHGAEGQGLTEEQCLNYAVEIDEKVRKAVAEFSINPSEIENQITLEVLPLLFADLGVDKAQVIAEEVVQITGLGLAGHH